MKKAIHLFLSSLAIFTASVAVISLNSNNSNIKNDASTPINDHGNLRLRVANYSNPYQGNQLIKVYCTLSDNSLSWAPSSKNDNNAMFVGYNVINYNSNKYQAVIFKTAPGLYFLQYNYANFTGGSFTIGGNFTSLSGNDKFYLETTKLVFDIQTKQWSQDDPDITYTLKEEVSSDNDIYVSPTDNIEQLTFATTKGNISNVEYENGAIVNNKFAIKEEENESIYTMNVNVSYDGAIFTKRYNLHVGYHDFVMKLGASPLINGVDQGLLKFSATVPTSLANTTGAKFGMIIANTTSLGSNELNVDNLFYHNELFSFEKGMQNKIYVKNNIDLKPIYNNNSYLIEGYSEAITSDKYATPYLAIAYMKLNNQYYLANHHNGQVSNSKRSLYQIAQLATDKNTSEASVLTNLYINNYSGSSNVSYIVREHLSGNIKEVVHSGTLNDVITVNAPSESGYRVTGSSSITAKLYAGDNIFDFYYDYYSSLDVYCWGFPDLDTSNDYINETNQTICQNIKECGISTVIPMGNISFPVFNQDNAESYKHIIRMFNYYGLKTIVNGDYFASSMEDEYIPIIEEFPDFSDTPGFAGFLLWDEPNINQINNKIIPYMDLFDAKYGSDTNAMFMCNLLPTYASSGGLGGVNYDTYINAYIDALNNHISSTKFISLDSYPIYPGNLISDFPKNIAYLVGAAKSMNNSFCQISIQGAQMNGQAPDFTEADYTLQAYTAMAMGVDSINWFTYAQMEHIQQDQVNIFAPVGKDGTLTKYYERLKNATNKAKRFKELLEGYTHSGFYTSYNKFSEALNDVSLYNEHVNVGTSYNVTDDFRVHSFNNNILGVFDDGNNNHAYLASNYNMTDSSYFRFYTYRSYTMYRFDGTNITTTSYSRSLVTYKSILLSPGEAILLIPN